MVIVSEFNSVRAYVSGIFLLVGIPETPLPARVRALLLSADKSPGFLFLYRGQ